MILNKGTLIRFRHKQMGCLPTLHIKFNHATQQIEDGQILLVTEDVMIPEVFTMGGTEINVMVEEKVGWIYLYAQEIEVI